MNDRLIFEKAFEKAQEITGLRQKDVAAKLGVTPSSLSPYANGKKDPGLKLVSKVASVFNFSLVEFLNLGQSLADGDIPGQRGETDAKMGSDREIELLRKLEIANDEARQWRLKAEELEKGFQQNASSGTDAMETALNAKIPVGLSTTELSSMGGQSNKD